jgi:hypothetical protein
MVLSFGRSELSVQIFNLLVNSLDILKIYLSFRAEFRVNVQAI